MKVRNALERRNKLRFVLNREIRYRLIDDEKIVATGMGETVDMSSGGVAFRTGSDLTAGNYLELSISWPALLDDSCPVRLVVYGRVVRRAEGLVASTVEKWEFRTGSGKVSTAVPIHTDNRLIRWLEYRKEVMMKTAPAAGAVAASASAMA